MPVTFRTIATDVLKEIGAISIGETPEAAVIQDVLAKIQTVLNNWNADRRAVYATAFPEFTLVPNLSPHTIGPTGATFTVTQRPVSLDGCNLILNTSPTPIFMPIDVRDHQWWLGQTIPGITTSYPTDVYYQPDWPNGKLFFWPVPTSAYGVQLMVRVLLNDVPTLDTTFSLPPGYQDAITMTSAEDCLTLFPAAAPGVADMIEKKAREARSRIFDNNDQPLRLQTADAGMQVRTGNRGDFNFWTGQVIPR